MKNLFVIFTEVKWLTTVIFSALSFSLVLAITLNLNLAFFSLVIFSSLGVFHKSFHYGLLFFLVIILIFPSVNIINGLIATRELFAVILSLIGVSSLVLNRYKFKMLLLFYYWFILISMYAVITFCIGGNINVNNIPSSVFMVTIIIYSVFIILFQYFFQTIRRLERLFLAVVFIGIIQAMIGFIFQEKSYLVIKVFQLDNFYGHIILAITIPVTLGMYLIQKSSLSTISFPWLHSRKKNIYRSIDVVSTKKNFPKGPKKRIVNLKRSRINMQRIFIASLALQGLSLIITSSYITLIITSIGVFIIGVLMRNKKIILVTLSGVLILISLLSNFEPTLTFQLKQTILDIIATIKNSHDLNLLWQGFGYSQNQWADSTYLFIFNKLGLVGLLVFLLGLVQYFREIRFAYLRSEEFERIWLVVILGIFIEFLFLGIFSNVFFIGPAALLFWVLYGILQNLKHYKKEYQLLETKLIIDNN